MIVETVPTLRVVKQLDVIGHIGPSILPCAVGFPFDSLTFQSLKKALCHGVDVAVTAPTHAANQVVGFQKTTPIVAVLTALIGVNHLLPQLYPHTLEHSTPVNICPIIVGE